MKIIVGLGNPGREYQSTRHNVGFRVLDELAKNPKVIPVDQPELKFHENDDYNAMVAETSLDGEKIFLVKPMTFMNESGQAISRIGRFYKVEPEDIWVVADDIDLPLGTIRIRLEGSSGGHRGLDSIITALASERFPRVRLGIGQATQLNMKEFDNYISDEGGNSAERSSYEPSLEAKAFVLSPFGERELAIINPVIEKAAAIIIEALSRKEGLVAHTYEVE